jgi:hypothetical protein
VRTGLSAEQIETMNAIKEMFAEIARTESATCRLCGHRVRGTSFGEILQRLGVHGDRMHPEYWEQERAKYLGDNNG